MKYIISLDQGTTSSRAIIFDENSEKIASSQKEFPPVLSTVRLGRALTLWRYSISQTEVLKTVVKKSKINLDDIAAIGITNQRETTIVWEQRQANQYSTPLCGSAGVQQQYATP